MLWVMLKLTLLLWLALFGAMGTLARFGVSLVVQRVWPGPNGMITPAATLTVNGIGCFFFGLLASALLSTDPSQRDFRLLLLTGFLGAFTTFSTFSYDTLMLFKHAGPQAALLNVLLQNIVGLSLAFAGLTIGQRVAG